MDKYLNEVEKELLALVNYHRKDYENTKLKQGGLHPDDIKILEELNNAVEFVNSIAKGRKEREQEKYQPIITQCPDCNVEKQRVPIYEQKNEHGYMTNIYQCAECNIEFTDGKPNNAKDQLHALEELINFIEKNKKDFNKIPAEMKKELAQFKIQYANFKQKCEAEEKSFKIFKQTEQELDKAIIQWRDYLLFAKVNKQWGNAPIGKS